ncbi:MAG: hypothetical protein E2O79_00110, partial [Caldithrix sp.]
MSPYRVSFYNGTLKDKKLRSFEKCFIPWTWSGRLYAIDPDVGKIDWRFESFNPQLPEDPDGGGELVSSPVIGADGTIYFGSRGIGPCETNDFFYAVNPDSTLQWRFPSGTDGASFDSVHLVSVIEGKQQYKCGTVS